MKKYCITSYLILIRHTGMEFYRHLRHYVTLQNFPVNLETEPDPHEKSFKR